MEFLVIDDEKTMRDAACLLIEDEGHYAQPISNGQDGLEALKADKFDAVFLDVNLDNESGLDVLSQILQRHPNLPVVIITAQATVKIAVEAIRRGAIEFLEKPFTREHIHNGLSRVKRFSQMDQKITRLKEEVSVTKDQNPKVLLDFATPAMMEVMDVLTRAANTPASILIMGPTGTGKSVVARAVHQHSRLAEKPFVTVSCPSLSKELLESELFGHVRGAFTGAIQDRWGKVNAATTGTLFLDEIGDLPLEIQPKLLRLLQEREYERLGENKTRKADVRIIAATNRNLKQRIAEGLFREDLYFRLNVITVEMPPLCARQNDLLRFAEHFLKHFARQCGRPCEEFSEGAIQHILAYSWPGNLRELRNAIERAVILQKGEQIQPGDLPTDKPQAANDSGTHPIPGALVTLEELGESHIRKVLEKTASVVEAAKILGIDDATIYRKRKKMGF